MTRDDPLWPQPVPATPDLPAPPLYWQRLIEGQLDRLRSSHLFRQRRTVRSLDATHVELPDGRRLVNFASNDYLGLTHHPAVIAAAAEALHRHGLGSGASALISGYTHVHAFAEERLARWKGTESAVLLGSGYQANLAAVQTIAALADAGRGVRFLLDKLVHASLVDAVRASALPFRVFPHNNLAKLARLLADADPAELQVVVTESIFSMDGDAADLHGLAELKKKHRFMLLLDEAHASGVYGAGGAGQAAELGLQSVVDVSVITLSKALGCFGGAVCSSGDFCDALVNWGRAYIYATSVPPATAAGVIAAIEVLHETSSRRQRVRELALRVREALNVRTPGDAPIIPIILGDEEAALSAAGRLQEEGIWVLAVRPPTVPRGTSRLRITLSSEHTDAEIERLIEAVRQIGHPSGGG